VGHGSSRVRAVLTAHPGQDGYKCSVATYGYPVVA
jgi:hypothetical protein